MTADRLLTGSCSGTLGHVWPISSPPAGRMPSTEGARVVPKAQRSSASPAASVLPGHLIAATGAGGRWVAVALMVIAGAGVGAALMVSPPIDAHAAGWRLVIGLTLMFLPAPASRAGSFIPA